MMRIFRFKGGAPLRTREASERMEEASEERKELRQIVVVVPKENQPRATDVRYAGWPLALTEVSPSSTILARKTDPGESV